MLPRLLIDQRPKFDVWFLIMFVFSASEWQEHVCYKSPKCLGGPNPSLHFLSTSLPFAFIPALSFSPPSPYK